MTKAKTIHAMHSITRSPLAAALAASLFAWSAAMPVAAQQAPGWLNWGGGSNESSESDDDAKAGPSTQSAPVPAANVAVADNQSGQAVLLQRLMQRVDELERQVQGMSGQLSEQERTIERQQRRLDDVEEVARSAPSASSRGSASIGRGDPVGQDVPEEAVAAVSGDGDADEEEAKRSGDQGGDESARDGESGDGNGGGASEAEQQALYNEAFEVLKSGKYEQAVEAFQKVIDANPQGEWAAGAFFWQGETYYVQQDYAAAGKAYGEVIERFPDSNRIPDAKLKLGYVAEERGDNDAARRLLQEVIDDHPDSQAAGLAKQRLSRLGD